MANPKRSWAPQLLIPHALAAAAFLGAAAAESAAGTNRTALDFNLAMAGYGIGALALISTGAAAVMFPWRDSRTTDWVWLLVHMLALIAVLQLASNWMGGHIA